ncbi:MAG: hypothetical protein ACRC10_01935 [Thermoguttaceae bacterium]
MIRLVRQPIGIRKKIDQLFRSVPKKTPCLFFLQHLVLGPLRRDTTYRAYLARRKPDAVLFSLTPIPYTDC